MQFGERLKRRRLLRINLKDAEKTAEKTAARTTSRVASAESLSTTTTSALSGREARHPAMRSSAFQVTRTAVVPVERLTAAAVP